MPSRRGKPGHTAGYTTGKRENVSDTGIDAYLKELKKFNSATHVEKVRIASQNFKEDSVGVSCDPGNARA